MSLWRLTLVFVCGKKVDLMSQPGFAFKPLPLPPTRPRGFDMLTTCPHCSASVNPTKLERHIRKVHTSRRSGTALVIGSHVASRSPSYGEFRLCTCDGSNDNCRYCYGTGRVQLGNSNSRSYPRHYEPRKDLKPLVKEPLVYLPPLEPSRRPYLISNVVKRPKVAVRPRVQITAKPAPAAKPKRKRDKRVACPKCGQSVKEIRLESHLQKPHSGSQKKVQTKKVPPPSSRNQTQVKTFVVRPLKPVLAGASGGNKEDDLRYESPQSVRAMDYTREYAHAFREQGRYGSHPSHDGFDDESNP